MAPDADSRAIAEAFVRARRNRIALAAYPGARPADLTSAYAIQDAALGLWSGRVGGWKVGRITPPLDARLGADRLAGPVAFERIVENGSTVPTMTVFEGGFAAGEAEFMVRLAPPELEAPLPRDDRETLGWIDAIRIGIEIAASPYPGINADGPCVTISDHGNNLGLVLGQAVPRQAWSSLGEVEIESFIEGRSVARASASTMLDGPLGAVRFLLANLRGRGIALERGWWISTGAVTGVHELRPGKTFRAAFDGVGELSCRVDV